jgi:hypothetical protein
VIIVLSDANAAFSLPPDEDPAAITFVKKQNTFNDFETLSTVLGSAPRSIPQ